ncbi:MAG: AmpE protein [Granulosicoccus sp.]|jgi:AmpE protein
MDFLSVILAYLVSISLSGHGEPATAWVLRWRAHLVGRELGAKLTMVIYALLPALLVACLLWWVDNFIFNLVLSVTLLLLAFQSGDQPENLAQYQQLTAQGERQGAWQLAVDELGLVGEIYEPDDELLDEGVQAGMSYLYLERFFVSVFWFMAFGAPGVLLVWLMSTALRGEQADAFFQRVKQALYWIPVRLMALTLGLMGNFSQCFQVWLEQARDFDRDDRVLLLTCLKSALGSVAPDEMLGETLSLIKRAQMAWLISLAVLLIFGF